MQDNYRISITDEQPRAPAQGGKGREKEENAVARALLDRLVINGRWGKISGYETEELAKNGARAIYKESVKRGQDEKWRARTRIQRENDGTFSLFVRRTSLD